MDNPIRRSAAPLADTDLALLEHDLGLTLPAEYRAFLLAHNGGVPRRNRFHHRNKKGQTRETWVRHFFPATRAGLLDHDWPDLRAAAAEKPRGLPADVLPVGAAYFLGNEGTVCLACGGPDAGKVFFRPDVEPHKDTLYAVADSWAGFLAGMSYEEVKPKAWLELLLDGDRAGFRNWLGANRRKWDNDRSFSLDIERAAVEENDWPAVLTLIEHGFDPGSLFEEALNHGRYELAARLLGTGNVPAEGVRTCLTSTDPVFWALTPLLEALVQAGADVNSEADAGDTPLHAAVEARSEEGVRFLVARGADPTAKNDDGRTPLALARRLEEPRLAELLKDAEAEWKKRPAPAEPDVAPFDLKGVTFRRAGPPLTLEEIKAFEAGAKLSLPPEYRWLLLQANGGKPSSAVLPAEVVPRDEDDEDDEDDDGEYERSDLVVSFLPLRETDTEGLEGGDEDEVVDSVENARGWYHDGSEIPRGMVPIGSLDNYGCDDVGYLLLGWKGKHRGKLFAFDHGAEPLNLTLPGLFAALAAAAARPKTPGERLADAVAARDLGAIRAAVADGAKPGDTTRDGREPPLRVACEQGFDDGVLAMADAGAKLDELLAEAVSEGRFALARRLLAHGKGPSKKGLAEALMMNPALFGDVELVNEFVARGVDLKKRAKKDPYLAVMAASGGSVDGLKLVLDAGADPHAVDDNGQTLLHHAAGADVGDPAAVVRFLLGLGVTPNRPTPEGWTALHSAVAAGNVAAAKVLIDAGEDLHARHEKYLRGMTREQSAAHLAKTMKAAEKMLGGLLKDLGDDGDGPPPPDTSTPDGEKAAEVMAAFGQYRERMTGELEKKLAERAGGSWGTGPSAAELGGRNPARAGVVAELAAYAAGKKAR